MASAIFANGNKEISVPAGEKIAVFSNGRFKVYQKIGYPNYPDQYDLLNDGAAGSTYTSAAFSAAATVRIEAGPSITYYETGAAPSIAEPQTDITASDATFTIDGLNAAQGGYVYVRGGTSSTAGNAGGEVRLVGGTPGATGVGGAVAMVAAAGGATSGTGGAASVTAGAGTNGNASGGAATVTAGAGQGTGSGGVASLISGASGAGATGNGGQVNVTAGAAASTNGNGGNVVLTPGAKSGSGIAGMVVSKGVLVEPQGAPTAVTTSATLTAAGLLSGIITVTHTAGATQTYTLPTGTLLDAAVQMSAGESFDWVLINLSAAAADTATVAAGTDHTIVGGAVVQSAHASTGALYGSSAIFRSRKTAANTFVTYRIA